MTRKILATFLVAVSVNVVAFFGCLDTVPFKKKVCITLTSDIALATIDVRFSSGKGSTIFNDRGGYAIYMEKNLKTGRVFVTIEKLKPHWLKDHVSESWKWEINLRFVKGFYKKIIEEIDKLVDKYNDRIKEKRYTEVAHIIDFFIGIIPGELDQQVVNPPGVVYTRRVH